MMLRQTLLGAVGLSIFAACANSFAQSAESQSSVDAPNNSQRVQTAQATPASAHATTALEEVTVTAEKRSENLQDVPVAVSVVTQAQLENAGVATTVDLDRVVPSLQVSNVNGYFTASIRGVGSDSVGPGVESQVAIYLDNVYMGSPVGSILDLNNIDQIAVLKGPQGTLFGRNATAGVVQITTRDPTDTLTLEGNVGYGSYNQVTANAYVSDGLTDNLRADLAVTATHQPDGWGKNIYNGQDDYTTDYDYATRSKIIFTPMDGTKFTLIGDYSGISTTMEPSETVLGGTISGWVHGLPQPDLGYDINQDGPNLHKGYAWGGSLQWDQDLGPVQFVSVSAFRRDRFDFNFDYDYGPQQIENIYLRQEDRQFSEEARLQSQPEQRLKWVVGFYYYNAKDGDDNFVLPAYDFGLNIVIHNYATTDSYAGFAQATYDVLPDTNLTVGLRYNDETRGDVDGREYLSLLPSGFALPALSFPEVEIHSSKTTYRVSLDHRFSDEFLMYASYNTGFKSGGFNANPPGSAPYSPEQLKAWEVGAKSDLFDRRLRLNAAGFYYDYTNIQVQQLNQGAVDVVNAASATIYGLDADLTAALTDHLRLMGAITLVEPKFDSYPNCLIEPPQGGVPASIGSCKGNLIPLAAPISFNTSLDYTTDLDYGSLDLNANVYFSSGYSFTVDNSYKQEAYGKIGASATWISPDDEFSLTVYGRNLTDVRVATTESENTGNGNVAVSYAAPRTFGVIAGFKFAAPAAQPAYVPPPPAPLAPAAPAAQPTAELQREFQVFFDFDKSNITDAASRVIAAAATAIKAGNIVHISVTGHTDTVGSASYNQGLSERRASAVNAVLVADGVKADEISTVGVGKSGLLVSTGDGVREPQNRRAVIDLQ